MFAFLKAKRRGMRRLLGWSSSNTLPPLRDPKGSFAKHKARECKVIARRWDALAQQAETEAQRELRQRIANGWRDLAGGR
jgi:hypothetical protein